MPRGNQKGGKKHKRGKKDNQHSTPLRIKEDGQEYAQIKGCKGNCRFDVICFDGKERIAILCGSMRKKKFVNPRDVILVSLRDFQDDKCDIIDVYDDSHITMLKEQGQIPDHIKLEEDNGYDDFSDAIEFVNELPPEDENTENDDVSPWWTSDKDNELDSSAHEDIIVIEDI